MGKVHYSLPQASFHRADYWYKVMASILSLNGNLAHRPAKQELVGCLHSLQRAIASKPASTNSPSPIEELVSLLPDNIPYPFIQGSPPPVYPDDGDFPMGEAGPLGVDHNTASLTRANAAENHDDYGLSKLRRSHRIVDYVDRVGQQQWGSNHVWQLILDKEESDEEGEEGEQELSDEEEHSNSFEQDDEEGYLDSFEQDNEYAMLGAEPGQEGVSVWDLLGEGFLKEASKLGLSLYLLL
jgi:hypothetical protein